MIRSASKCLIVLFLVSGGSLQAQFKLYEKGHDSYIAGKYESAIRYFSEYLTKATRDKAIDIDVFYLRALSYYKLNQFELAIPDFEETILRGHTNKGNIYWFMAKCYEQSGNGEAGLNSYKSAIRELKDNSESYVKLLYERGILHSKLGKTDLAVADFQEALSQSPSNDALKKELDKLKAPYSGPRESSTAVAKKSDSDRVAEQDASTTVPQTSGKGKRETNSKRQSTPGLQPGSEVAKAEETVASDSDDNTPTLADLYKNEKRYALVVGVSKYGKSIGELKNPVNDATDMAKELQASHFEVQLLTNATYGQIRAALMQFKENLDAGDKDNTVGLFYFAGHGIMYEEENYLVPADASVEYEDDIPRYCFPIQRMVLNNMERSNTRMNIVILDACRNNPFPSLTRSVGRSGLGEMKRARGTFVAYATAPGSVAQDGTGRNGLYTQELLKALGKKGLTIEQVFKEVRANVLRLSGNRQNTWDSSNIVGEFHFKY